jgi:glyoxalase/bleomycin resistance protein/dioxygenase superfamily protein
VFELVQPLDGPSIYKEWLEEHGEGVQHIACMMHSQADSDAFKAEWEARGAKVLMGGRIGETIEFYYLDTEPMLKFVLESGSGHAIDLTPSRTYPPS